MDFMNVLSAGTIPETPASSYANLTVPAINIIFEVSALILLIGAAVAGILLLRNHVRSWLYPFGVGLVFHLVFRYTMFNRRFGLMYVLFSALNKYVPFLQGQDTILSVLLTLFDAGLTILAIVLAVAYWKKGALRDHRPFTLGGAIALGFSAYIVNLIASGFLSQFYGMITNSQLINANGFENVLNSYVSQTGGMTKEEIIEELRILTSNDVGMYVKYLLGAATLILEAFVPIAIAVVRFGVVSERLEKKWNWVVILLPVGLMAMPVVQTLSAFDSFAYVSFGYTLVLAAFSVWLIRFVSVKYMEKDWNELSYTRKKQKQDEQKEKNKMPKIEMPKD